MYKKISVVGLGYIGLPTAAMFASRKIQVVGVEVNINTIDIINQGKIHIVEPDLDILVHSVVSEGFLKAVSVPEEAEVFIIAVPTPFKEGNEPDLSYIKSAAKSIAPFLSKGNLIILESTSPVGTTEKLESWFKGMRPDLNYPSDAGETDIFLAHCPERVLPGQVVRELVSNDRIIGGLSADCAQKAKQLYEIFVKGECFVTSAKTAEMAKLTENSYRDVNIAFANELSIICDGHGIDVVELIELSNKHPRVSILRPGPGVGGHCIAVDPWFIVSSDKENSHMIRTAREVNDYKPKWVVGKISQICERLDIQSISIFGITFKPDIDDLRESPSLGIAIDILSLGIKKVGVVEPNIIKLPDQLSGAELISLNDGIEFDLAVVLVDHKEFYNLNYAKCKNFLDFRGVRR